VRFTSHARFGGEDGETGLKAPRPVLTQRGRATRQAFFRGGCQCGVARRSPRACVPCMRSCSGVKVLCPGGRGAAGQGKRKGVTARWGLKAAWNARAGRGTRTRYEVWYRRDERARDRDVLHPQVGGALYIGRRCTDGMTASRGRPLMGLGKWRATESG
jgi:hypothetical protein